MPIFVRYYLSGRDYYGLLAGEDRIERISGSPFDGFQPTGEALTLAAVQILPPCRPTKVIAVGLNYRDHAREFNLKVPDEPLIFMKPPSSLLGAGEAIIAPTMSRRVDFEAELGVVIGRTCRRVTREQARGYILGYTCVNDITARDLQEKDGQWTRAKGFDTFCPVGPFLVTDIAPDDLAVQSFLNGEPRQSSRTRELIFSVEELVSFISRIMTLVPGDIISTGTPSGVGPMQPGDTIEVRVEQVGRLINTVVGE
ncbi:MAG: fumarylacetoacetate hydrolase family protein [Desulfobacterota bacterium]|jgi:2-keto-4-pentenoate hydratase/2-oxohepta-3-ene-1,7-dioic acid hydratase in catechol pathway|nr:fumarylacetoacetate hydrolase family protein [Thermodesulfobacteriota bacterium]